MGVKESREDIVVASLLVHSLQHAGRILLEEPKVYL